MNVHPHFQRAPCIYDYLKDKGMTWLLSVGFLLLASYHEERARVILMAICRLVCHLFFFRACIALHLASMHFLVSFSHHVPISFLCRGGWKQLLSAVLPLCNRRQCSLLLPLFRYQQYPQWWKEVISLMKLMRYQRSLRTNSFWSTNSISGITACWCGIFFKFKYICGVINNFF